MLCARFDFAADFFRTGRAAAARAIRSIPRESEASSRGSRIRAGGRPMTMRWSAQAIQAREQAREEERRRLARELHDELGHALFGLRMHLVWLQQRITN